MAVQELRRVEEVDDQLSGCRVGFRVLCDVVVADPEADFEVVLGHTPAGSTSSMPWRAASSTIVGTSSGPAGWGSRWSMSLNASVAPWPMETWRNRAVSVSTRKPCTALAGMRMKSPGPASAAGTDLDLEGALEDEVGLRPRVAVSDDVGALSGLDDDELVGSAGLVVVCFHGHRRAEHLVGGA